MLKLSPFIWLGNQHYDDNLWVFFSRVYDDGMTNFIETKYFEFGCLLVKDRLELQQDWNHGTPCENQNQYGHKWSVRLAS